ncbi:group 10 secretory phospholipase A2 isoform X2 [Festucalex cinctus]
MVEGASEQWQPEWGTCLLPVAAVSVATAASASTISSQRSKRGLLELAGIISCSTGRSPLAYVSYGCYCGLGGQGWPRDRTDWCCHKHDCCYDSAERQGCHTKTDRYDWTCDDKTADCDDLTDMCEKLLCKCDRDAAKCLRNSPYKKKYTLWPNWWCGYRNPMCTIY